LFIVYPAKKVEEIAAFLVSKNLQALPYHAGLDAATRSANQPALFAGEGMLGSDNRFWHGNR